MSSQEELTTQEDEDFDKTQRNKRIYISFIIIAVVAATFAAIFAGYGRRKRLNQPQQFLYEPSQAVVNDRPFDFDRSMPSPGVTHVPAGTPFGSWTQGVQRAYAAQLPAE